MSNSDKNNRRHGRVRCQEIECSLGEVTNLSAAGMCVRTRYTPPEVGSLVDLTLSGPDGPIAVRLKIVWAKKAGLRGHEVGFNFVEVTPNLRRVLTELARQAAHNETFKPFVENARRKAG